MSWPEFKLFKISITYNSLAAYQLEQIQVEAALSEDAISFQMEV